MQQIADWLEKLGLSEYAQCFAENDIDFTILGDLTDQDLEKIGIASLGHRRKLLRAIANLETIEKSAPAVAVAAPAAPLPLDTAERRQVTVMFADLVGSTALSARMDPEDLREVISAYQKCAAETVRRFDGFVAKYMGDGVLVYFGYPQAHEDDAERAVRAGLELIAAVAGLKTRASLQTRVGIATGVVVVGELIGSGEAQERGIVGETPNLAARLQAVAAPNKVVISDGTRRLLGNLFELQELEAKSLKGISGSVRAWAVLRPSSVESRFEALHPNGLSALVGREEEAELMSRRWSRAKTGEGQVVLISGEAGIGKSRLTAALLESLAGDPHTRLRYFCSPQHTDSALYPIIAQIERAAGLTHDDAAQAKLDKLDALLAKSSTSAQDAALFAEMLSLPNDGRHLALDLSPQQRREKTLAALTSQVAALARWSPVLMIFEDAHWVDPTSLEVFSRTVDRIEALPVLLVVTFRPEFDPPWVGRAYVTALTINRLTEREARAMIDRIVGNKPLPPSIREDVVERSDGIPLFIEEMTKAVLEAESQHAAELTVGAVPSPALAVPASLHASLMARLDRLGPAKDVAQVGAAIGREFSHALLAAVARKPESELSSALDRLIQSGLLFRQGVPPHANYLFKHALVQDAAYGTLLREPRRALHARIVETLGSEFAEIAESQPELMARHCTEAGFVEEAVDYWERAGRQALGRSAMAEAVAQLTKGLEVLESLSSGPEHQRREINLQLVMGPALIAAKGFASPEAMRAYARARELCRGLGDVSDVFPALYGQSVFHFQRGELVAANELAQELLRLAEERGEVGAQVTGHRLLGATLSQLGRLTESRDHFTAALGLYDPVRDRSSAFVYAVDSRVISLSWLSHVFAVLGYPKEAAGSDGEAPAHARELNHPNTMAVALVLSCMFHQLLRDTPNARSQAEAVIALATEQDFPFYLAAGTAVRGWVLAEGGRAEEAVMEIRRGAVDYGATGAQLWSPYFLGLLAEAQGKAGQATTGLSVAADALDRVARTGARWIEADLQRIRGELLLLLPEPQRLGAEACFGRAIVVAREQGARLWELRAATSLARLWFGCGKRQEARDLLAPVYSWFTEGFDTRDLKEAKALLDALAV